MANVPMTKNKHTRRNNDINKTEFLTNQLTSWNRVLLEKLTVTQPDKKFPLPPFMETKDSLSWSQEPATGPYHD
jgi:hypothetical protein